MAELLLRELAGTRRLVAALLVAWHRCEGEARELRRLSLRESLWEAERREQMLLVRLDIEHSLSEISLPREESFYERP
jgi:hypothetical protein